MSMWLVVVATACPQRDRHQDSDESPNVVISNFCVVPELFDADVTNEVLRRPRDRGSCARVEDLR